MPISMSRTTTSLVAVGAGVILLSAAGGSFAQWSDSKPYTPGSISSGKLAMQAESGGYDLSDAVASFTLGDLANRLARVTRETPMLMDADAGDLDLF